MSVTPDDIAVELGRTAPSPTEVAYSQWQQWIADALELDQGRLDYVVRQAVAMHVRRPDDATQVAVSVDDGQVSKTYRSSRGRVEILDEWWALLAPADTTSTAFSIRPSGSTGVHVPWCSIHFGSTCSCGADLTDYQYPLHEGGVLDGDYY